MFLEYLKIKEFNPKRNFLLQRKGKIISRCSFIFQITTFAVGNEIVNEMAEKIRGKGLLKIVLTTTTHSSPLFTAAKQYTSEVRTTRDLLKMYPNLPAKLAIGESEKLHWVSRDMAGYIKIDSAMPRLA